jgi:hypothetical protein
MASCKTGEAAATFTLGRRRAASGSHVTSFYKEGLQDKCPALCASPIDFTAEQGAAGGQRGDIEICSHLMQQLEAPKCRLLTAAPGCTAAANQPCVVSSRRGGQILLYQKLHGSTHSPIVPRAPLVLLLAAAKVALRFL